MTRHPDHDDALTLIAMGVLAVIIASLTHEMLGHGLTCLAQGGHITLLTFLVFRCEGAGILTDGAGPIAVLVVGWAILALLLVRRPKAGHFSLFLLVLSSLLVFWAPAQAVREAFDNSDDWGHVATSLNWPPQWHSITISVGAALCYLAIWSIALAPCGSLPDDRIWPRCGH